jgi:hypothetical protein
MRWDGRTKNGKAERRGYADGFAERPIPAIERQADTWPVYEEGYAQAKVDQANHKRVAAQLAAAAASN